MSKPIVKILNLETNELIEREMNDVEFAQWEKDVAEAEANKLAAEQAKTARETLLAKLGITEAEAKVLLG